MESAGTLEPIKAEIINTTTNITCGYTDMRFFLDMPYRNEFLKETYIQRRAARLQTKIIHKNQTHGNNFALKHLEIILDYMGTGCNLRKVSIILTQCKGKMNIECPNENFDVKNFSIDMNDISVITNVGQFISFQDQIKKICNREYRRLMPSRPLFYLDVQANDLRIVQFLKNGMVDIMGNHEVYGVLKTIPIERLTETLQDSEDIR